MVYLGTVEARLHRIKKLLTGTLSKPPPSTIQYLCRRPGVWSVACGHSSIRAQSMVISAFCRQFTCVSSFENGNYVFQGGVTGVPYATPPKGTLIRREAHDIFFFLYPIRAEFVFIVCALSRRPYHALSLVRFLVHTSLTVVKSKSRLSHLHSFRSPSVST